MTFEVPTTVLISWSRALFRSEPSICVRSVWRQFLYPHLESEGNRLLRDIGTWLPKCDVTFRKTLTLTWHDWLIPDSWLYNFVLQITLSKAYNLL